MEIDSGLRTSTNTGLAGAVTVIGMFIAGAIWPAALASASAGLEAAITVVVVTLVARFSKTPKAPGKV